MRTALKFNKIKPPKKAQYLIKSLAKVIFGFIPTPLYARERVDKRLNNPLDREKYYGSRSKVWGFMWGQRKWLASAAIVLFVFFALDSWGLPPTKDPLDKPRLFGQEEKDTIIGAADNSGKEPVFQNQSGFLGGPTTLGSLVAPVAQASIDFSADDELEDVDLALLEDNSVISLANPSGMSVFFNFRREITKYIVKQGDAPERIAASFNINTDTLLWANGLRDGDIIKPGQEIIILPINGVRVKTGAKDTVESLAKKYSGVAMEIIAFNNLSLDGALAAGEYVIVPGGEMPAPVKPKYAAPAKKYAQATTPAGNWLIWPTTGRNWGRLHGYNAVDIANDCGTPVYAAATGKVAVSDSVGWNGGYGKYVKIEHSNGVATLYAHASSLLVEQGQEVGQGQVIMLMGTTGRSTGCHTHFEVRGAANPLVVKRR